MLKKKVKIILELLDEHYPVEDKCYLSHDAPYELLIATILSAQCTDDRVNKVTEVLFKKYPSLAAFADADLNELESYVRPTGVYRMKAKNIIATAGILLNKHNGKVPDDIGALTALPGVGRKTANLILGHVYGIPGVTVDTHVKRISKRWGLTDSEDPVKIEYELMKTLPKEHWIRYNTQVIAFGRAVCKARNPKCEGCAFKKYCMYESEV